MTAAARLSPQTVVVIVVGVMAGLFLLILGGSFLKVRRPAPTAAAAPAPPTSRPTTPVSRRDFFRGGLLASAMVFAAQFAGASIAFLWPNLKGGFGSVIAAGTIDDIKNFIQQNNQPFYSGTGRFYIVPYNGSGKDPSTAVDYNADGVISQGLMPLYQRCVHLGCRVPFCQQSQWFECPCHGSKYNKAGEYQLGPAPHGMDRFKIIIAGDQVSVDTSTIILGPPRGTDTIHEAPQGPFCVAPG